MSVETRVAPTARLAENELRRLLANAQQGRPGAVDALLTRLRPWFLRLFARRVERDVAEDLAQAALIRLWNALPRIEAGRVAHYLVTIAMNLLRTAFQDLARENERHAAAALEYPLTTPMTPDREAEHRDLARIVHHVSLATLSPELHEVVVGLLRDLRQSEIAADQNLNSVTVRTRVRRARRRLAPRVRQYFVRERIARYLVLGGADHPEPLTRWSLVCQPSEDPDDPCESPCLALRSASESGALQVEVWAAADGDLRYGVQVTAGPEPAWRASRRAETRRTRTLFSYLE